MNFLEKYLVVHCAPTLAAIKSGSLFTCAYASEKELDENVEYWNRQMQGKGIRLIVLKKMEEEHLFMSVAFLILRRNWKNRIRSSFFLISGFGRVEKEASGSLL